MIKLVKHFLVPVHMDGEQWNAPCFFRISFSEEELRHWNRMWLVALELKERLRGKKADGSDGGSSPFRRLVLWDDQSHFFRGYGLEEAEENAEVEEKLRKLWDAASDAPLEIDGETALWLDSLLEEAGEEDKFQRLEYCFAEIDEDGLSWRACPKHAAFEAVTDKLSWEQLGLATDIHSATASAMAPDPKKSGTNRQGIPYADPSTYELEGWDGEIIKREGDDDGQV